MDERIIPGLKSVKVWTYRTRFGYKVNVAPVWSGPGVVIGMRWPSFWARSRDRAEAKCRKWLDLTFYPGERRYPQFVHEQEYEVASG